MDDDESASQSGGADLGKRKKVRSKTHNHIGPNVRAWKNGMAFCPVCDVGRTTFRMSEKERDLDAAISREIRRKKS